MNKSRDETSKDIHKRLYEEKDRYFERKNFINTTKEDSEIK